MALSDPLRRPVYSGNCSVLAIWYCMTMLLIVVTHPVIPRKHRFKGILACALAGAIFAVIRSAPAPAPTEKAPEIAPRGLVIPNAPSV